METAEGTRVVVVDPGGTTYSPRWEEEVDDPDFSKLLVGIIDSAGFRYAGAPQ